MYYVQHSNFAPLASLQNRIVGVVNKLQSYVRYVREQQLNIFANQQQQEKVIAQQRAERSVALVEESANKQASLLEQNKALRSANNNLGYVLELLRKKDELGIRLEISENRIATLNKAQEELNSKLISTKAIREARKIKRQADELLNDIKENNKIKDQLIKETQERINEYDEMLKEVHQIQEKSKKECRRIDKNIEESKAKRAKSKAEIEKTKEKRKQSEAKRKQLTERLTTFKERNQNKPIQKNHKSRSAPILTRENIFFSKFAKRISDLKQKIDMRCNKYIHKTSTSDTAYIHLLVTIKSTLSAIEGNKVDKGKYVLDLGPLRRYKTEFKSALADIQENLYQPELSQYPVGNTNGHMRLLSQSAPNLDRHNELET